MTSQQLTDLIEERWELVANRAVTAVRQDAKTPHLRQQPEWDLRDWARNLLKHLPNWAAEIDEGALRARYERLGRQRIQESIPLSEVIRALHHLKCKLVEFIHDQDVPRTSVDLYNEQELEYRIGMYFDHVMYWAAVGYEQAQRGPAMEANPLVHSAMPLSMSGFGLRSRAR